MLPLLRAVAKQIVELLHGGLLSVFSKGVEGEGSVFTVRLSGLLEVTADNNDTESPIAQDRRNIMTVPSMLELSLGSITNVKGMPMRQPTIG